MTEIIRTIVYVVVEDDLDEMNPVTQMNDSWLCDYMNSLINLGKLFAHTNLTVRFSPIGKGEEREEV